MKFSKILALVASLLLLSAGALVSAQTQSGSADAPAAGVQDNDRGHGRRGGFDRPRINLSADQQGKLKSLREGVRQQIEALRNDTTLSNEARREKIQSLREGTRQQFQAVLTPEQQQLLQNARNDRRDHRGRREGRGFGSRRGEGGGLDVELGLTADQRSQLESIHQSTKDQLSAIRNDATLNSEQKEAKLKALRQNSRQQLSTILTPEQQQKLKESHRGGPGGGRRGPHGRRGGAPQAADKPATKP